MCILVWRTGNVSVGKIRESVNRNRIILKRMNKITEKCYAKCLREICSLLKEGSLCRKFIYPLLNMVVL